MDWVYGEAEGRAPGDCERAISYIRTDDVPGFPTYYHPQAYQVDCCVVPHNRDTHYQSECSGGGGVCCVLFSRAEKRWFPTDFSGSRLGDADFATRREAAREGILIRMGE